MTWYPSASSVRAYYLKLSKCVSEQAISAKTGKLIESVAENWQSLELGSQGFSTFSSFSFQAKFYVVQNKLAFLSDSRVSNYAAFQVWLFAGSKQQKQVCL